MPESEGAAVVRLEAMSAHTNRDTGNSGDRWTDGGEKDGHGALRESGRAVKAFPRRPELGLRDSRELGNGILQTFCFGSFPEEGFLLQLVLRGCNKGNSQ